MIAGRKKITSVLIIVALLGLPLIATNSVTTISMKKITVRLSSVTIPDNLDQTCGFTVKYSVEFKRIYGSYWGEFDSDHSYEDIKGMKWKTYDSYSDRFEGTQTNDVYTKVTYTRESTYEVLIHVKITGSTGFFCLGSLTNNEKGYYYPIGQSNLYNQEISFGGPNDNFYGGYVIVSFDILLY